MFGVKTPIAKCRKSSKQQDFDGIRAILSKSKLGASWTPHVNRQHGDVYFVEYDNNTEGKSNSLPSHQLIATGLPVHQNGHASNAHLTTSCDFHPRRQFVDNELKNVPSQESYIQEDKFKQIQNGSGERENHIPRIEESAHFRKNDKSEKWRENGQFSRNPRNQNSTRTSVSNFSYDNSLKGSGRSSDRRENGKKYDVQRWKDVFLVPNYRDISRDIESGVVLCEKLFGIILCHYNHKSARLDGSHMNHVLKDRKVIVQGVVPRTAAEKSGQIHRGDMLISINDTEVTWLNIDKLFQVLRKKEVKLTFQTPVIIGPKPPIPPPKRPPPPGRNLYRLVSGCDVKDQRTALGKIAHRIMYLTLCDSSEPSSKDDIVYMYPQEDNKLVDIRGLYLTLSSSLVDITNSTARCTSIQLQNVNINVVYSCHGKDVLVICLPANRVPLQCLNQLLAEVKRLLRMMFGGISSAFRDCDRDQLDQLFALIFHHLLSPWNLPSTEDELSSLMFLNSLTGIHMLHLSEEYELICDEILSEFEAADFDDFLEEDELNSRRNFMIIGSSLFYKEYLLCSHLPSEDSVDLNLFLKHHLLLKLLSRQSVDDVVIWREVWPTRHCHDPEPGLPGYQEPGGRWFLLIVGMKHFLLGTLLEAGGCTSWPQGKPGPHPLYVDQAKATLLQLETDDVAMADWCEERLLSDSGSVSLVGAERYLVKTKSTKDDSISVSPLKTPNSPKPSPSSLKSPDNMFRYHSSPQMEKRPGGSDNADSDRSGQPGNSDVSSPVMLRQGSKLSYGSNDSVGSGSSTGAPRSKSSRKSFQCDMASIGKNMSALQVDEVQFSAGDMKLTRGKDNVLFHFVKLYDVEGIYITPSDHEIGVVKGAIHSQVLENFYRCSLRIRTFFEDCKLLQRTKSQRSSAAPRFGFSDSFKDPVEHGILFRHCFTSSPDSKKHHPVLVYWVVGRCFPPPDTRELYVCFHESANQSLVEMAFSLGFGT